MSKKCGKIFGIGLSRTGTTSLSRALNVIGYKSIHYPFVSYSGIKPVVDPKCVDKYDGFTDIPVSNCFKYLDKIYPNSKFIYTVRKKEGWLKSCKKYFGDRSVDVATLISKFKKVHIHYKMYGCVSFDRDKYLSAYEDHDRKVREYFSDRQDDLLVLNICEGEGYEKLCSFLDKPMPSVPFPKSNSA